MKKSFRWLSIALCAAGITGALLLTTRSRRGEKQPEVSFRSTSPEVSSTHASPAPENPPHTVAETSSSNSVPLSPLEQALQSLSRDTVERKPQIDKIVEGATTAERVKMLDQLWSEETTAPRRELATELLQRWAHEMPQAAAEWLAAKPIGPLHQEASRSVAIIWANQNLNDAAAWVRRWPEDEKEAGLIAVAYEAARTSPKEALWLASELAPTPARDGLIAHTVREWAAQDADAPAGWAEKMESSTLREEVFANTAISLSETDPGAAATLALQKLPPGGRQDDTVVSIVQRWAQNEPAEAADWVAQFPEGRVRDAAVENLVQIWSEKSPEKPIEWLNGLEDGPVKDAGMGAYARKVAPSSPETALTWAGKITNPETRAHEIESLLQTWMRSDRKAASTWIQTAPALPDELKSRLIPGGG